MVNDTQFTALTLSPDVWRYLPDAVAAEGNAPGVSLPATEARGYIIYIHIFLFDDLQLLIAFKLILRLLFRKIKKS